MATLKLDREAFRDTLKTRADKKRVLPIKLKPDSWAPIVELLTEIRDLLKQDSAPKFEVTEWDDNGKIKSFKVNP